MAQLKNIDTISVVRAVKRPVTPPKPRPSKPKQRSFGQIVAFTAKQAWQPTIFQISLLRTLFSPRALGFSVLALVFFVVRGTLVQRPDQLLQSAHGAIRAEQTSTYIYMGGVVLFVLLLSWLMDMLVVPILTRQTQAKLQKQTVGLRQTAWFSMSTVDTGFLTRLWHSVEILLALIISVGLLAFSQLHASSLTEQVSYGLVAGAVIVIIWALEVTIGRMGRAYQLVSGRFGAMFGLNWTGVRRHPLHRLGYGLVWLATLAVYTAISFGLVWAEIKLLNVTSNFTLAVCVLAGTTTLIYLLWTNWFAMSSVYWTALAVERVPEGGANQITFGANQPSRRAWPLLLVVSILALVLICYFFATISGVDVLIDLASSTSKRLPKNLQLLLPKPN